MPEESGCFFPAEFSFNPGTLAKILLLLCLYMQAASFAHGQTIVQDPLAPGKWSSWWESGINSDSGDLNPEFSLFAPILQGPNSLLFVDWQGQVPETSVLDFNISLGLRQMLGQGWNVGGWIGLGKTESELGSRFYETAAGFELLNPDWDFRINGYMPVSKEQFGEDPIDVIIENSEIAILHTREEALPGAEFELGWRLPTELLDLAWANAKTSLRLFGGGYYFDDSPEKVYGVKARAELQIHDVLPDTLPGTRLTAEIKYLSDNIHQDRQSFSLRLRVPFNSTDAGRPSTASLSPQAQRMVEQVNRRPDTYLSKKEKRESAQDFYTNVPFERVAFASDDDSLADALGLGPNTLIIVEGNIDQTPYGNNGPTFVGEGQTLVGSGGGLTVAGQSTGKSATFNIPGQRPIFETSNFIAMVASSNTHVSNIDFVGTGMNGQGVRLSGATNSYLRNNRFFDLQVGVFAENSENIHIIGSTFSNVGSGVHSSDNTNIWISENRFLENNLGVNASNSENLYILDNEFSDSQVFAINFWSVTDSVISDNHILASEQTGIRIAFFSSAIDILDNYIDGGQVGIWSGGFVGNSDIRIMGNQIANTEESGIKSGFDRSLSILSNILSDTGLFGIDLSSVQDAEITGNAFTGAFVNSLVNLNDSTDIEGQGNSRQSQSPNVCFDVSGTSIFEIHFTDGTICEAP